MKKVISMLLAVVMILTVPVTAFAASGWVPMTDEPETHEAFWGEGATVADVCNAITGYWLPLTNAQMMGYIGVTVLGQMAENSIGCTVTVQVYTMQITGQPIHYLYEWSVTESDGTVHGPYRYQPNPYVAREVEEDEVVR